LVTWIGHWLLGLVIGYWKCLLRGSFVDGARVSSMTRFRTTGTMLPAMINAPEYEQWLETVPADITEDPLWRMTAYR